MLVFYALSPKAICSRGQCNGTARLSMAVVFMVCVSVNVVAPLEEIGSEYPRKV